MKSQKSWTLVDKLVCFLPYKKAYVVSRTKKKKNPFLFLLNKKMSLPTDACYNGRHWVHSTYSIVPAFTELVVQWDEQTGNND